MANVSTSETVTRLKKQLTGVVISDKMNKTVVVRTDRRMIHPLYEKVVVVSKKFVAHDESNERKIGDQVRIQQTRPLSKTKRWVVIETLRQAPRETKEVKAASENAPAAKTKKTASKAKAKATKTATKRKK